MQARRWLLLLAAACSAPLAAGCGAGADAGPVVQMADSAGRPLVRNVPGRQAPDRAWSAEPVVTVVGGTGGAPEFFNVVGAVRLMDGTLVVANAGSGQLLYFDADGRFVRAVGREGDGPGEYRTLSRLWRRGADSVVALEFRTRRLTVYDAAGEMHRVATLATPDGRQLIIRGVFSDGSYLAGGTPVFLPPDAVRGVMRDSAMLHRFDADGTLLASYGYFPYQEAYRAEIDGRLTMTDFGYQRMPVFAAGDGQFVFGAADGFAVRIHDAESGAVERYFSLATDRRRVTAADMEWYRGMRLAQSERGGNPDRMRRILEQLPTPEFIPPYNRADVLPGGEIWVSEQRGQPGEPLMVRVFAADGTYLSSLEFPGRFDLLSVDDTHAVGRARDEMDEERVVVFAVRRR